MKTILDDLQTINERMAEEVQSGDFEAAHSNADKLLIEALQLVTPDEYHVLVLDIIAGWHEVGKWYA
jgi:hypothetical protein